MKKSNKVLYILGSVFLIIGVLLLIISGLVFAISQKFYSVAQTTEAIITDIVVTRDIDNGRNYDVYIDYEIDGTKYDDVRIKYYNSSMDIGDTITVYYDPSNPSEVRMKMGSVIVLLVLVPIGVVFSIVGILLFSIAHRKKKKIEHLKETGRRIYVEVNGVVINNSTRINGKSPYRIECSWLDENTGKTYLYKSENIWFDPTNLVIGTQLPAYVDPNNLMDHYIDISAIEDKVVDCR
jgi:hypothetical protein